MLAQNDQPLPEPYNQGVRPVWGCWTNVTGTPTPSWQRQGKPVAAEQLLEGISSWFTEGFDTLDLQEAQQLLATLRKQSQLPGVSAT